jgi:hypothetical protein
MWLVTNLQKKGSFGNEIFLILASINPDEKFVKEDWFNLPYFLIEELQAEVLPKQEKTCDRRGEAMKTTSKNQIVFSRMCFCMNRIHTYYQKTYIATVCKITMNTSMFSRRKKG